MKKYKKKKRNRKRKGSLRRGTDVLDYCVRLRSVNERDKVGPVAATAR